MPLYVCNASWSSGDGLLALATDNREPPMPRPSRPLDPSAGPIQAFAAELRKLREDAGGVKYLQMARRTGKSRTALSEAAGGDHLPTWDTVAAFVRACGGEVDAWRLKWERVSDQVKAGQKGSAPRDPSGSRSAEAGRAQSPPSAQPQPQPRRVRRVVLLLATSLAGAAIGSIVTLLITTSGGHNTRQSVVSTALHASGPMVITVQNKVALGANQLIEDTTPAYLSSKPVPFCSRLGCELPGTKVSSGALLVAICHVRGTDMFNYNLDSLESKANPNRADSALWYKVVLPDRRSGYISEVYITPNDRGGLGLPACSAP